jgi:hypothetical protein
VAFGTGGSTAPLDTLPAPSISLVTTTDVPGLLEALRVPDGTVDSAAKPGRLRNTPTQAPLAAAIKVRRRIGITPRSYEYSTEHILHVAERLCPASSACSSLAHRPTPAMKLHEYPYAAGTP